MKTVIIFLGFYFSIFCGACNDDLSVKLLQSFFENKNCMITANVCWKIGGIVNWMKYNLNSDSPSMIAVHRSVDFCESFFSHLSTDNFFVLDLMSCQSSWRLLDFANSTELFRYPLKYLLLVNEDDFEHKLTPKLKNYTVYPNSDVNVAKFKEDEVELVKVYRVNDVGDLNWEHYGVYKGAGGFHQKYLVPAPTRRRNLQYKHITIVGVLNSDDSLNHLEDFVNVIKDTYPKQTWGASKSLLEYCNVNYTFMRSPTYGYYNKTSGTWNGIVDDLHKKRAILSVFPFLFTKERLAVVDFIHLMNPLHIKFIFKKPPISFVDSIFTIAFQKNLWYALIGLLILLGVSSYIILKYERKQQEMQQISVSDVVLLNLEAVCQQGTLLEVRGFSARLSVLLVIAAMMLLYVAYSGNILIILQSTREMKSVKELVDSNMAAGGFNTIYMRFYLPFSKDPDLDKLYQTKIGPKGYYELEDGMKKVQGGFFAFYTEVIAANHYAQAKFTEYEICSLQKLYGYIPLNLGYLAATKASPYKKIFIVALHKICEHGIHKRNYDRIYTEPKCYGDVTSFISIGLIDMYQAVMIMCYGAAVSVLVLGVELLIFNLNRKRYRKFHSKFRLNRRQQTY